MAAGLFYVYQHNRGDTGQPFYVGKGMGDRAYRHTSRNPYWRSIVSKCGQPSVVFLASGVDEELAFLIEMEAIDKHRLVGLRLANMTDGGEGVSGFTRKQPADEIERRRRSLIGQKRTPEQCARIAQAKAGHGTGRKQSAELVEKRISKIRGRKRPDVALRLGGKTRPQHVIDALSLANDERYCERRARLAAVIAEHPDLSIVKLAALSGCEREMVGKYKRMARDSRGS
jgi:hypothetical protein